MMRALVEMMRGSPQLSIAVVGKAANARRPKSNLDRGMHSWIRVRPHAECDMEIVAVQGLGAYGKDGSPLLNRPVGIPNVSIMINLKLDLLTVHNDSQINLPG
jgi:hypothetical protein